MEKNNPTTKKKKINNSREELEELRKFYWERLKRNSSYLDDYKLYVNESDQKTKMNLDIGMVKKYGLLYIVPPYSDDNPFPKLGELSAPVQVEFSKEYLQKKGNKEKVEAFKENDITRHLDYKRFLKLKIDTHFKKETILKEFKIAIDQIFNALVKANLKPKQRNRLDKYSTYFEIWDLRKKKISFAEIAKETNQKIDTCKKQFYIAWELITKKKYAPEDFKRSKITKSMLKKTCDNCPDHKSCDTLCPDAMAFVGQDKVSLLGIIPKSIESYA